MLTRSRALALGVLMTLASAQAATYPENARHILTPRQAFGAAVGDDYFLATYSDLESYWRRLDRKSNRMSLVDIGRTEEGRTQLMAVVTAPENHAELERYRGIARRLALASGLTDEDARALAAEGKAIVCIAGGLHATEVLSAQQLIQLVYELVSANDPETERILRDVIVLVLHANPDGHELVARSYMSEPDPRRRSLAPPPRPYQKYVGHDNNRDFYMATQSETININRVLFRDWFPQIVYDHHQAPLRGAAMFAPPFSGPVNPRIHPQVVDGVDEISAALHERFGREGKRGVVAGDAAGYSMWWNGGLRTTPYFHNQIGLLTETAGSPTPGEGPPFRVAVDYSVSANRAALDIASRAREQWLYGIYRMGRNAIAAGLAGSAGEPRAYVLPPEQPDFPTAAKFVGALLRAGVSVHRATLPFTAGGKTFGAGSFVVRTGQAFRPHVLDMFEPQSYPDEADEGNAPYDNAGWTLGFQMGVVFDRVFEAVEGNFVEVSEPIEPFEPTEPAAREVIPGSARPSGYRLSHRQNDAVIAINRLLRARESARWIDGSSIYIARTPTSERILREVVAATGVSAEAVATSPAGGWSLHPARIALVDRPGGWSTSGWMRWLLERYEFPFDVVTTGPWDATMFDDYDIVILPSEAVVGARGELPARVALPALRRFAEGGGTVLAIGTAASVGRLLGLPVSHPLASQPPSRFNVPGSVLRAAVYRDHPLGFGFGGEVDVMFNNSPVFTLRPGAEGRGIRPVVWFNTPTPLRSGHAVGQDRLQGMIAGLEAPLGRGRVVLFGPDITFRAQSHGTFKFLFNTIYYSRARPSQ
jgi:putative intracellular protease/amidase